MITVAWEEVPLVPDDPLLTVDEVAARIRTTPETVRRWLRGGRLAGVRPGGTRLGWRVREADLQRFLSRPGTARDAADEVETP
jgi:excisionase family DNA binding protein